jgi:hypothetical protein
MLTFIKNLMYDKQFVEKLKQERVHKAYLENLLLQGKITLKEFLRANYKS